MFPILLAGSLLFYLAVAAVIVAVAALVICERAKTATLFLVGALIASHVFTDFSPLTWISANPMLALSGVGAYLAIGVIWVYPKWASFYNEVYDVAIEAKAAAPAKLNDMLARRRGAEGPPSLTMVEGSLMASAVSGTFGKISNEQPAGGHEPRVYESTTLANFAPQVAVNKSRILAWMSYWPVSMFWTLLNDPIRRFYAWVYRSISGSLQRMSDAKFADTK